MSGYAPADAKTQWFTGWEASTIDPNVEVIHTTEGTDWPTYEGGSKAPHYTAKPDMQACRLRFRQHFPETSSARALRNLAGGVETNTLNCRQIELVGTCDPLHRKRWNGLVAGVDYIYWPEAPEWALNDLADYLADGARRLNIPVQAPEFLPYPASFGPSRVRFSFAKWRKWMGWCGHQHVPEQDHGDPGKLPVGKLLDKVDQILHPRPQRVKRARTELVGLLGDAGVLVKDMQAVADLLAKVPATRKRVHAYADQLDQTIDAFLAVLADADDDLDNLPTR